MAIALVTGGTRGIGFAVARTLLGRGHSVVITGTTDEGMVRAEHALAAAVDDATRVMGVTCDVRDRAAVRRTVDAAVQRFGGLDVLVNNAGVGVGGPIAGMTPDEWSRLIDTNLTGVFHCCQAAMPHLKAKQAGWIVNVSSLAGRNPFPGGAAYCATKAGLNAFAESVMLEVRQDNIRVSTVMPGSVQTSFSKGGDAPEHDWKLSADDVAQVVFDLLAHSTRSLPSRVEIRPSKPK